MEKHFGVYICEGCGIGSAIKTGQLLSSIDGIQSVTLKKCHSTLCSSEGVEIIRSDIQTSDLDGVIIGACSPRVHTGTFRFENKQTERVNLREQVTWCSNPDNDDTQLMAEDYLKMSIAKILNTQLPYPYIAENISSDILIVGGGISGIAAAIGGARAGYQVVLVEKEPALGGRMNRMYKQLPVSEPFVEPIEPVIQNKIQELKSSPNVKILTSSVISEIKGQPGNFEVSVKNGRDEHFRVGAIVACLGWQPYDAGKLSDLGYGKYRNIITSVEFEDMAKTNKILLPGSQEVPQHILFIQCAGSRDKEHLSYCSSVCCSVSLKQVKYIREINPDARVYIVYKDIRIPGLLEEFYKEEQKDELLFLTKGDIQRIEQAGDKLRIDVHNTLLTEKLVLNVDLVVLATGMVPADTTLLNIQYRQGKGLPSLKYQFPDSHFICFPYETRRTGIYAAGTMRAPMNSTACEADAAGAVFKAIQCIESVKRGEAVLPRTGDRSFPDLYLDRCTDCKRCTEECPFGSYDETPQGTPLPNPNRCRRCGICVGSCPERVINFADFSINSVSQMIKSISMPDEFENKPRILAFVCENDAYPAFDMAGLNRLKYSPFIRIIPVRCIGSVNKVWISDALSRGFDGILHIGCKPGNDYQCHYIHGSELTETRSENLQETLATMMLEPERIRTVFLEITEYGKIPQIINDYVEQIELIGPNPFKSM